MKKDLRVSDSLALPADAVTQTFAIFGKRGAGKSNTAVVLAEEMFRIAPFVVLDPIDAWWGLKSSFDGQGEGLGVYIFGGDHADLPLEPSTGELMADVFIEHRIPMVLSMKGWTGKERAGFVTAFALRLLAKNNRYPVHVFLEEADAFIPQRPYPGEEAMLGAMDRLVRWGRQEGIGATIITQRSAKVNKDVTTQAETLIAHRTIGPQDRDAIDSWIKFHAGGAERNQILSSLPTLPSGTAWVWSPEWLGILEQVSVRRRRTYDSASTPKVGEKRPEPKKLADVDLEKLRAKLATTIERAKADDPKELRKRIQDLEKQLAAGPQVEPERIEIPVISDEHIRELSTAAGNIFAAVSHFEEIAESVKQATESMNGALDLLLSQPKLAPEIAAPRRVVHDPAPRRVLIDNTVRSTIKPSTPAPKPASPAASNGLKLGKGEHKVLSVLAQWPNGLDHNRLAFLAGYSAKASTLGVILSNLRRQALAEPGQPIRATPEGLAAAGGIRELPKGRELLDHWLRHPRMGEGERKVLQALIDLYPRSPSHEELCEATGYSSIASTMGVILSRLRKLGLVEKGIRRVPDAFMEAIRQ